MRSWFFISASQDSPSGNILLGAVVIPDRAGRQGLGVFHEREAGRVIAFGFEASQFFDGCNQREQERLGHVARADDPGGDAVDAGVEIIQPDAHAARVSAPHNFLGDGLEIVGERDDVVAVPADAAADVQRDFREIAKDGGDFVRDAFGGMIVAGVEREQNLAADGVAEIKLVRAGRVTFRANAEEFRFDGIHVELRADFCFVNGVERFGEAFARAAAVGGRVLHAVGNPQIGEAGLAERLADGRANFAGADAVFDPVYAGGLVGAGKGEAVAHLWMREEGWIEIEADLDALRPGDPVFELFDAQFVAVNLASAHLGVAGMEIQAMASGNDGDGLLEIGAQFRGGGGLAGIISRDGEAAAEFLSGIFKSADVVALPAMDGNRDAGELFEGLVGVDAEFGVALAGEMIGLRDSFRCAHCSGFSGSR